MTSVRANMAVMTSLMMSAIIKDGMCGRVQAPMTARLSRFSRSRRDDYCGTCKILIGARCTVKMVSAVVCVVRDSSTTTVAGSKPKNDSWKKSKVLR